VPWLELKHLCRALHPWHDARAVTEAADALARWRPDLVSTHTAKAGWIGRAASARLGLPALYTPHGWPAGGRFTGAAGVLFTVAERIAARWCSAIVCVSEYEKDLALRHRIAPAALLKVVPNGVRDVCPELRAVPDRLPVRICTVARFEAPKDHSTLLEALARMQVGDWELDLVGDGPLEAAAREQAARLGIAARVHFSGYLPDPAPALAAAQVFALASRSESFPRSILEAMRAGLPVVASAVGGVDEAVSNGTTGLLATPCDPAALAAALTTLVRDAGLRARMGAAGRAAYVKRFRLETMVDRTASLYERVLKSS
jgi:glycosyltransferase involved in cell wall biosynthesis